MSRAKRISLDNSTLLAHFLSIGATLYSGPMAIEKQQSMCQVRDLWGNCIGLRGLEILFDFEQMFL